MQKRSREEATGGILTRSREAKWEFQSRYLSNPRKDLHVTKNLLKNALVVLGLALCTCTAAHALAFKPGGGAPEADPSLVIGGFALLAGTLAVLRVRRKK
jgi:LPXTG-motif cell wall-anchored protein